MAALIGKDILIMQLMTLIIIYSTAYDGQNQWQEREELAL